MPLLLEYHTEIRSFLFHFIAFSIILLPVQKVASISIWTMTIPEETNALFGLIQTILLVVLSQLMRPMCKFTLVSVGTISKFNELLTQLQLFLNRTSLIGIPLKQSRGVGWVGGGGVSVMNFEGTTALGLISILSNHYYGMFHSSNRKTTFFLNQKRYESNFVPSKI